MIPRVAPRESLAQAKVRRTNASLFTGIETTGVKISRVWGSMQPLKIGGGGGGLTTGRKNGCKAHEEGHSRGGSEGGLILRLTGHLGWRMMASPTTLHMG